MVGTGATAAAEEPIGLALEGRAAWDGVIFIGPLSIGGMPRGAGNVRAVGRAAPARESPVDAAFTSPGLAPHLG